MNQPVTAQPRETDGKFGIKSQSRAAQGLAVPFSENADWEAVAKEADWDHIVRVEPNGTVSATGGYAPPLSWSEDGGSELETSDKTWTKTEFHPSEYFEPQHYKRNLGDTLDEGQAVEFYLTSIENYDDPENPVGWALVQRVAQ